MNRKLLVLITITILVGSAAFFINNIESEVPAGTIETVSYTHLTLPTNREV